MRLSDFIKLLPSEPLNLTAPPLYSDARTGQVVIADKGRDETPALPELKTGDIIVSKRGLQYRVHRVHNGRKHGTEFEEPVYRLERTIIGNQRWTLEELAVQGMKIEQ